MRIFKEMFGTASPAGFLLFLVFLMMIMTFSATLIVGWHAEASDQDAVQSERVLAPDQTATAKTAP